MKGTAAVTGASGKLGRIVAKDFVNAGWRVVAVCRRMPQEPFGKGVRVEVADLSDVSPEGVHKAALAFHGCDVVVNLAGTTDARLGWSELYSSNVRTARVAIEAARQAGVRRLVHCSSTSVHRKARYLPIDERHPFTPMNDYGLTKQLAEKLVRESGLAYVILRPTIIYGPCMAANFAKFAKACLQGRMATVGRGDNRLGFVFEEDAARAFLLAATARRALGHEFIIASGERVTQAEAVAEFAKAVGAKPPKKRVAKWAAYAAAHAGRIKMMLAGGMPNATVEEVHTLCEDRHYDAGKARRLLGWAPRVRFKAGVALMARRLRKSASPAAQ